MAAYDLLPPELRLACRQALHKPRAEPLLAAWEALRWRGHGSEILAVWMRETIKADHKLLEAFAQSFERRWRVPYPHTAARASVLYSEEMPWGGRY